MSTGQTAPHAARPITVREALPEEYDRIADLLIEAFSSTFEVSAFYEQDLRKVKEHSREFTVWVATSGKNLLGTVFTPKTAIDTPHHLRYTRPWEREFRMLGVSPAARGRGVGKLLIDHAIHVLARLGVHTVCINTGLRMKAARHLYESYGFVRRRERETLLVDGGYRIVTYTYGIPSSQVMKNPALDALESDRKVEEQPDVPGSIPGFLAALKRRIPEDIIDTDKASIDEAATDRSGYMNEESAIAVVRPHCLEHVQAIMATANRYLIPVYVRGAGSGLVGGTVPVRSGVVLSTVRLNRLFPVNIVNRSVRVQAGVITAHISNETKKYGLFYAPDPASSALSTLGGNIATNAGGFHCVKYGVTRDSILSLTAVLADGTAIRTGAETVKDVAGLDLTSLLTGSEGTLAVVVDALVRLRPIPSHTSTIIAFFRSLKKVGDAVESVMESPLTPSIFELMGVPGNIRDLHVSRQIDDEAQWMLILQLDEERSSYDVSKLSETLGKHSKYVEFLDKQQAAWLFDKRKKGKPFPKNSWMAGADIAVPVSRLVATLEAVERIAHSRHIGYSIVSHVGDGNLHIALFSPRHCKGSRRPRTLDAGYEDLLNTALDAGGSLTGEHGVGIELKDTLVRQLGRRQLDLQTEIKRVFDPHGILNPGKWL